MTDDNRCPGWPVGSEPCGNWGLADGLCPDCGRKRAEWHERLELANELPSGPERAGVIMLAMDPIPSCLCGGYEEAPSHEVSLLHLAWLNRQRTHDLSPTAKLRRWPR